MTSQYKKVQRYNTYGNMHSHGDDPTVIRKSKDSDEIFFDWYHNGYYSDHKYLNAWLTNEDKFDVVSRRSDTKHKTVSHKEVHYGRTNEEVNYETKFGLVRYGYVEKDYYQDKSILYRIVFNFAGEPIVYMYFDDGRIEGRYAGRPLEDSYDEEIVKLLNKVSEDMRKDSEKAMTYWLNLLKRNAKLLEKK